MNMTRNRWLIVALKMFMEKARAGALHIYIAFELNIWKKPA